MYPFTSAGLQNGILPQYRGHQSCVLQSVAGIASKLKLILCASLHMSYSMVKTLDTAAVQILRACYTAMRAKEGALLP